MEMFDTVRLEVPLVCPDCVSMQSGLQTHTFDDVRATFRPGSVGGSVLKGVIKETRSYKRLKKI